MVDVPNLDSAASKAVKEYDLDVDQVNAITTTARSRMVDLLAFDGPVQIPSFVTQLPRGSETGEFLVVDLGGSHCRVCLVNLYGNSQYDIKHTKIVIPTDLKIAQRQEAIFDFVAKEVYDFSQKVSTDPQAPTYHGTDHQSKTVKPTKLAFTFSFTYQTLSLSSGRMVQWDKGWSIPDAIGKDPCQMLQDAIDRQGIKIQVCALTNDSVSTLVAAAFTSRCKSLPLAGIIFGTGTNAAYTEKLANITKLHGTGENTSRYTEEDTMVVNSEWGAWFDNNPDNLPQTECDRDLDNDSSNPGEQLFEKMVSGLYLAELLRLGITKAMRQNILTFTADEKSPLFTPYKLDGQFLSLLAKDCSSDLATTIDYLSAKLKTHSVTYSEARYIQQLSHAIVRRAARLSGAVIAALIIRSGRCSPTEVGTELVDEKSLPPTLEPAAGAPQATLGSIKRLLGRLFCRHESCQVHSNVGDGGDAGIPMPPDHQSIVIGVEGPLFEHHPSFEQEIRQALREIRELGPDGESRTHFHLTRDGSTLGAALIAHSVS